jgi:hypothetical protein
MEFAIHAADTSEVTADLNLRELARFAGPKLSPCVVQAASLIEEYFGPIQFARCVYGNEFCEHLIPAQDRLEPIVTRAREAGMAFTFLTPYVSDAGIEALRPLLRFLDVNCSGCEVVFNDWGVLNLMQREFRALIPVQGRLMNKSLRDPRITGAYAAAGAGGQALVTLRRSNLDSASYTEFLSGLGVRRVELDNLPQGIDLEFAGASVEATVYVPFGFISTSRICMAAGLHYAKRDKFQPGAPCHHECQAHLLEYAYTNSPLNNRDQKFYLKGNTYFYAHTEAMLRTLFDQASRGLVEQIVFQARLPMTWERDSF